MHRLTNSSQSSVCIIARAYSHTSSTVKTNADLKQLSLPSSVSLQEEPGTYTVSASTVSWDQTETARDLHGKEEDIKAEEASISSSMSPVHKQDVEPLDDEPRRLLYLENLARLPTPEESCMAIFALQSSRQIKARSFEPGKESVCLHLAIYAAINGSPEAETRLLAGYIVGDPGYRKPS